MTFPQCRGVITIPKFLSDREFEALKDSWIRSGPAMVLPEGATIEVFPLAQLYDWEMY